MLPSSPAGGSVLSTAVELVGNKGHRPPSLSGSTVLMILRNLKFKLLLMDLAFLQAKCAAVGQAL